MATANQDGESARDFSKRKAAGDFLADFQFRASPPSGDVAARCVLRVRGAPLHPKEKINLHAKQLGVGWPNEADGASSILRWLILQIGDGVGPSHRASHNDCTESR